MVKRNEINSKDADLMAARRQGIKEGNEMAEKKRHKSRSKTHK